MGGPMSVNDEGRFPWLAPEKELIKRCREFEKPVLGICLGAQLIASALGNKRISRFSILRLVGFLSNSARVKNPESIFPALPAKTTVFHWHGDTFDLPGGAILLGSSAITPVQAYLAYGKLLALQFHLEIKPENISLMINHAGEELVSSPYIQDASALSAGLINLSENKILLEIFLKLS